MRAEISPAFRPIWDAEGGFEGLFGIDGELYRQAPGRRTLRFVRHGKSYFVKIHSGAGWLEILKNLVTLRLPVLGAANEFEAIRHLERVGLAAPKWVAYASKGINPAARRSLIVTEDIGESVSLEHLCRDWSRHPPPFAVKRALISEVAETARRMHGSGTNHRDFYLCHFLRSQADGRLYVIDLHRAQIRRQVPRRWRVKDIGGLYFSAMDIGLTRRDLFRFVRAYSGRPLRDALAGSAAFWRAVERRAERLYSSYPAT